MVCVGFVGCPHRTIGSYIVLALSMLCVIIFIRILLYVISKASCGDPDMADRAERGIREVREIRERAATTEAMMQVMFHLYPPWLTQPEPEILNANANANAEITHEWDSKLVISAGTDHVTYIARPCPLNSPHEEPK